MTAFSMGHRARNLARATPALIPVQMFISQGPLDAALLEAVSAGDPPVGAISRRLVEKFGGDTFASAQAKQFVGVAVAARLERLGYVATGKRVRMTRDPVFTTGGLFRKLPVSPKSSSHELLARFVSALTDEEALIISELLARRSEQTESASESDD